MVVPNRGKRFPPARASASDVNACVNGSTISSFGEKSNYGNAGVTIEIASGTIRKIIGRGPTGSPST